MDHLSVLLQQHVALLQARCEHLEKNICAVSNANAALEKAFNIPAKLQAKSSGQGVGATVAATTHRRDRASTAVKSGRTAGGRGPRQGRGATGPKAQQEPEALVDPGMCGIQYAPVEPAGRAQSEVIAQQLQQWRRATRQYFEDLKSAGRGWQVKEDSDMLLLRSSVLQQQQQAIVAARQACCSRLQEIVDHSAATRLQGAGVPLGSPAAFCHGSPRNALVCAIEVSCSVRKCAQELEEAYVAGADSADLAAAAQSLSELFAARKHLLELGQAQGRMHPRHTGGVGCSSTPEQGAPAFSRLRGSVHNEANLEGAQASLQGGFGGRCAALRQIGYAWQHTAAQGRSVGMWPVSGHALPGMSWIPDDAWRMVAAYEGDAPEEGGSVARGPVGVVFHDDREAKAWITMIMQLQRLAWELYLMEASGLQLSKVTCALFQQAHDTQATREEPQRFSALRALHALLLPARGSTLSVGRLSACPACPSISAGSASHEPAD